MLSIISILIVYITLFNVIILLALFLRKTHQFKDAKNNFISVIIAFKNEAQNLQILINALRNQNYPTDKFEVILVDDYSDDDSFQLAKKLISDEPNFKVIKNRYNAGKKNALQTGIEEARFDILLFTDADCIPKPDWIKSFSTEFDSNTDLVYGYSPFFAEKNFINFLCRYENLFTSTLMTAFHNIDYPYMSFGRNLSYRKSLFERIGGFQQIQKSLSGDDDLFFQLAIKNNARVKLAFNSDSIVFTKCASNFKKYFNQKSRHISASKFYPTELKIALGFIYGGNILFQIFIPVALFTIDPFLISFIVLNWILKVLIINRTCSTIKISYPYYLIPVVDFVYFLTLILIGIRSRFKIVHWK